MRPDNWQAALRKVIAEARTRGWQWGTHDCVTFAAEAATAVSGIDYVERMRALYRWKDAREAAIVIKEGGGLGALVTQFLGASQPWGWCGAGDIILALNLEREILAVHDGYQLIAASERGLVTLPVTAAIVGWKV